MLDVMDTERTMQDLRLSGIKGQIGKTQIKKYKMAIVD
jgi:hypothetical protein